MWRFKPFAHKEQTGLDGRIIDIGNFKVQVRNAIAEGGFSCVYLARDVIQGSKQYALKHIFCNDEESQELVIKEIAAMKSLKGHPNVVTLYANAFFDMGRTKEAFLLMEYCEKSLVNVLENRGAGFFEEKQVLTIFRDVCNAVYAMHCQTPPIAHRDLKAENILLGADGLWKLCDFGSTSTNHKRFEKPDEMGIEEDNIRKYTTPAYRAPEMWDLLRRDLINEKVDIWALGCLLFRICYFKLAFDGESKLQVLNGNYRIPDLPKYNTLLTDLLQDMLHSSPNDRPDITQVWFRINDLLPDELQKSLPDAPPEMLQKSSDVPAGMAKPIDKSTPMPRRSPPPPPSSEAPRNASSVSSNTRTGTGPIGSFWTTEHTKDSAGHPTTHITPQAHKIVQGRSTNSQNNSPAKNLEVNLFPDDSSHSSERLKPSTLDGTPIFHNDAFNAFVADFSKQSPNSSSHNTESEAEVEKLKEQLARVNLEKAEITSKYEKLSAICRSQRQEIQELKQALATKTPSPSKDASRNLPSPGSQTSITPPKEKIEGDIRGLQDIDQSTPSPDSQQWQPFHDSPKTHTVPTKIASKSVRTRNGHQINQAADVTSGKNTWGFGMDDFKAEPTVSSKINSQIDDMNNSHRFGESKSTKSKLDNQPSGWAGF